jgi:hypothetical protein
VKFQYIGEYPDETCQLSAYGVVFRPGESVEVPAQFEAKALGNRFFELADDEVEIEDEETANDLSANPFLAELSTDKDALIAKAEAIGINVDRRWSASTITQKIEEKLES